MINRFINEHFYLSNFYVAPVEFDGITYQNNEAAFQAQKTLNLSLRHEFVGLDPVEAKRKGRALALRPDWEEVKEPLMLAICRAKFEQNPELMQKLLLTGNRPLEEGNTWDDREWGTVNGLGKNKLGKILMQLRKEFAEIKYYKVCRVRCKHCGNTLEYINETKDDNALAMRWCSCGEVGLDPSATMYRIVTKPGAEYEDLSEEW